LTGSESEACTFLLGESERKQPAQTPSNMQTRTPKIVTTAKMIVLALPASSCLTEACAAFSEFCAGTLAFVVSAVSGD
jgi:hypothetical protein